MLQAYCHGNKCTYIKSVTGVRVVVVVFRGRWRNGTSGGSGGGRGPPGVPRFHREVHDVQGPWWDGCIAVK